MAWKFYLEVQRYGIYLTLPSYSQTLIPIYLSIITNYNKMDNWNELNTIQEVITLSFTYLSWGVLAIYELKIKNTPSN